MKDPKLPVAMPKLNAGHPSIKDFASTIRPNVLRSKLCPKLTRSELVMMKTKRFWISDLPSTRQAHHRNSVVAIGTAPRSPTGAESRHERRVIETFDRRTIETTHP